jgi:serine palmitoyltransferase
MIIGHLRDWVGKRLFPAAYSHLRPSHGYAPLFSDFDSFYTRRLKLRIEDCFARPVTGVAGRTATCLDRTPTNHFADFVFTGETTQALNVSSYNYLGFAQSRGPCADEAESIVREMGVTTCGARNDVGTSALHVQAERLVADFVGTEDAMIVSMGFATNSTNLPALVSKGCLVISDELNHSSIRFGARLSGAMVRQYKHNDMVDLENLLREVISQGQPRTHRPWKKILIIVEGLYSMEGTLVDLPRLLQLKDIYKVPASPPFFFLLFLVRVVADALLRPAPAVLLVRRRGSLDWSSRSARSRRLRLLWHRPAKGRHPHGNFYQV